MTSNQAPKSARARRLLSARSSKLVENPRTVMLMKGNKSNSLLNSLLIDIQKLKEPHTKLFHKHNDTKPFEDHSSMEFYSQANDASLFAYVSHSKKRPNNLVLGRLFDHQVLDMFELGIEPNSFKSMNELASHRKSIVRYGSKPLIIFQGDLFETNNIYSQLKSFFLDFFRGEVLPKINLASIDHVIVLTAAETQIHFRHYAISLKKSGTKFPRVEFEEAGPHMDLIIRRHKITNEQLIGQAMKVAKAATKQKQKNIGSSAMGDKTGRIHMQSQDLTNLSISKLDGLKKRKRNSESESDSTGDHTTADSTSTSIAQQSSRKYRLGENGERLPSEAKIAGKLKASGYGANYTPSGIKRKKQSE